MWKLYAKIVKNLDKTSKTSIKLIFLGENIKILRKRAGLTQGKVAEFLGVNPNTISNYEKGNSCPDFTQLEKLVKILDVDAQSLLYCDLSLIPPEESTTIESLPEIIFNSKTPKNTMLSNHGTNHGIKHGIPKLQKIPCFAEYPELATEPTQGLVADVEVIHTFPLRTDRLVERQTIPIYDMEAVAGLVPLFADQHSQRVVEVMETTLIPKCDGGLRIVGDSMYPLLKSGDIVFYKQIRDVINNIIWGEMYLISFDLEGEEYIAVKYLQKSKDEDHVMLASHNEHHSPMDIHISRIRALAFIKASLRLNAIK